MKRSLVVVLVVAIAAAMFVETEGFLRNGREQIPSKLERDAAELEDFYNALYAQQRANPGYDRFRRERKANA
ncbi:predicted protein [Nematostella vectensis]|uniref:Uncharacterized protein n=1 Tax=Nematostella vectensis TaxID=45351 RepID=A7RX37_NEMVE|nr:predicted protein [Nematostella vectensis]|eukprot:XP_001636023.1 predicted protein [Nematostella vectensis]